MTTPIWWEYLLRVPDARIGVEADEMKRCRHSPEEAFRKLREADRMLAQGSSVPQALQLTLLCPTTWVEGDETVHTSHEVNGVELHGRLVNNRALVADGPDRWWVTEITEHRTNGPVCLLRGHARRVLPPYLGGIYRGDHFAHFQGTRSPMRYTQGSAVPWGVRAECGLGRSRG